jgi:hypothetical protein
MPEIDQAQYDAGKVAFNNGTTILSVIANVKPLMDAGEDDKALSFLLGFGDALLAKLRA